MPWWSWVSVLFLVVSLTASSALLVLRGLRLWRSVRSLTGGLRAALEDVMTSAAAAEARAVALTEGGERLSAAAARLQASVAEAGVLRGALGETQQLVARLRGAVPHK